MKGKSTRTLLHLALSLAIALVLNMSTVYRVQAQGLNDYFEISYSITGLPQTPVIGDQTFTVTVTGSATAKAALPISAARITGRIVAQNNSTGLERTLNPSYVVDINPFPSQGVTIQITKIIDLRFPVDSPSGSYTITGKLVSAEVDTILGTVDGLKLCPTCFPDKNIGVVSYKAPATVALSNMTQTFTGSPLTPTATTTPPGLTIVWTSAPDTNAGSYPVTATINDTNYTGSATGTFTISKASATVALSNMTQTFTGSPLTPTATTTPPGLTIVWTGAPDTNAGNYTVTATINDTNYAGSATGTFTIS
ncbi:MAG: MBG domain-containing protein, partial [Dehalococcoidia bacterium]|nr:MBG domain-containing protein [Dehalococcoidia bacterium]